MAAETMTQLPIKPTTDEQVVKTLPVAGWQTSSASHLKIEDWWKMKKRRRPRAESLPKSQLQKIGEIASEQCLQPANVHGCRATVLRACSCGM